MSRSAPLVRIRGQYLAPAIDGAAPRDLVGLSEIVLPWGRAALTERLEPQVITLRLIERSPLAEFPRHGSYVGARVEIYQPYFTIGRPAFVGQVTDESARSVYLSSGKAIEVSLSVADIPGILSQVTVRGDYDGIWINRRYPGVWKPQGYAQKPASARVFDLAESGGVSAWVRQISTTPTGDQMIDGVQADSMPDAWQLIDESYEMLHPLTSPSVTGDWIDAATPPNAPHIELYAGSGDQMQVRVLNGGSVLASEIGMSDEAALPDISVEHKFGSVSMQLAKRIVDITIAGSQQTDATEDSSETIIERADNSNGTAREFKISAVGGANVSKLDGSEQPGSWPFESSDRAAQSEQALRALVRDVAERIGSLNKLGKLPELTYVEPIGRPATSALLKPEIGLLTWIRGNKLASMEQMPRIVQLIGGELRWTGKRWEHRLNLVGLPDPYGKNQTIDELFGNSNRTISNFHASVLVADLFDVTRSTIA